MPQPFTVERESDGKPLATFDEAGDLILAGQLLLGGQDYGNGRLTAPQVPVITSGQLLCPPSVYAPAPQTTLSAASTTMAAFDSTHLQTGPFTVPPSGSVLITASFVAIVTAGGVMLAVGLAAHGTVAPIVGDLVQIEINAATAVLAQSCLFPLAGLPPGETVNLDLLGASNTGTGTGSILAFGQSTTTPGFSADTRGGPVVLTVQGV